jgi:hypothetical protein
MTTNPSWIVAAIGVSGAIAALLRWRGRGRRADLGFVSDHWVAEHRLAQPRDS